MPWKRMLAYITGSVSEDLLRRIEYLPEENRVLRNQIQKRILLTDRERRTLAERAVALGRLMADTVTIVKPETILKWHRRLVAQKFDGSRYRKRHGQPPTKAELEDLVVQLARENPPWGLRPNRRSYSKSWPPHQRPNCGQYPPAERSWGITRATEEHYVGEFHSPAPGHVVGNGFFHHRDLDALGTDDLLCAVLYPRAKSSDRAGGNEPESERGVDEADREKCDQLGWAAGGSLLFDP